MAPIPKAQLFLPYKEGAFPFVRTQLDDVTAHEINSSMPAKRSKGQRMIAKGVLFVLIYNISYE
jgi:hypothetical protein